MGPGWRSRASALVATAATVAAGLVLLGPAAPASAAEVVGVPSSGVWTIDGKGNGHGHGMSQYGARGAAIAGLSYSQILAFYYPGTTLVNAAAVPIRVLISGTGAYPTVKAEAGLTVTGVAGALPTTGIDLWRLVPITGGFQLQRHLTSGWHAYRNLPASKLDFRASDGSITLFRGSGAVDYTGVVSGVKSGSGAIAVNSVTLDQYVRGVVPSEMPASWQAPAVQAQAVAARSYGRYYVEHPRSSLYDICDTISCQVYGGQSAEQAASNAAVAATANKVLSYGGSTIFAEFSASNGGLTSGDGVHPYFVTKADPYDNAASGDPYLSWTDTAAASAVAGYYGLARVTQLQITAREGGGTWGGFVATGTVIGLNPNGSAASIQVSGDSLRSALGLKSKYFHIRPVLPLGNLESTTKSALHSVKLSGWTFDPAHTDTASSILVVAGSSRYSYAANLPRPDVQQVFDTASPNHGFNAVVPVPGGSTKLCIWGISVDAKDSVFLGCKTVTVPVSPIGNLETVVANGAGKFRVAGWTFDPDSNGGPGRVHVYVDQGGYSLPASLNRPDVQSAYGLANAQVGFDVTVPVPIGKHTICAYGINVIGTPGANVTLRCVAVTR